jgi:ABC-type microcin C transport system permease subunit YejB
MAHFALFRLLGLVPTLLCIVVLSFCITSTLADVVLEDKSK